MSSERVVVDVVVVVVVVGLVLEIVVCGGVTRLVSKQTASHLEFFSHSVLQSLRCSTPVENFCLPPKMKPRSSAFRVFPRKGRKSCLSGGKRPQALNDTNIAWVCVFLFLSIPTFQSSQLGATVVARPSVDPSPEIGRKRI